jgi:hypothetical protein
MEDSKRILMTRVIPTNHEKGRTRTQGIRLPHEASLIPWMTSDLCLFFCPINHPRLLREAIAELMLCGIQTVDRKLSPVPPMRQLSPPGSGCKRFFYFISNIVEGALGALLRASPKVQKLFCGEPPPIRKEDGL